MPYIPYIRVCADTYFLHYRSTSFSCDKETFIKGLTNTIHTFFRELYIFFLLNTCI